MSKRRNQMLLAGLILAGLAVLSIQTPSLTPWFVGWLLTGIVISFAYKRREPRLIGLSIVALLVLIGVGVYPRWQGAMQQVSATSSFGIARELTERLIKHAQTHGGNIPVAGDPAWQTLTRDLRNPYRKDPITGHVGVTPLPHRAGLLSATQLLQPDPAKAGDLTVFVAEGRFFVVTPRDEHGAPLPFSEDFSNLKTSQQKAGEARAVDQGVPGNQSDAP